MTTAAVAPLTDRERSRLWRAANREAVKERRRLYYEANREAVKERSRVYRAANCEATRESRRLYYEANREEAIERTRLWQAANREADRERSRLWRATHPDVGLTNHAKRRGAVIVERVDPRVLFERDGGKCHICSEPVDPDRWDVDHIVPIKAGGVHSYDNTAVSHPTCNRSKGAS